MQCKYCGEKNDSDAKICISCGKDTGKTGAVGGEAMSGNRCMGCMGEKDGSEACPLCGWQDSSAYVSYYCLPPGTLLSDRFIIGKMLAKDEFSITYISWDKKLALKLAITEYFPGEFASRDTGKADVITYSDDDLNQFVNGLGAFIEEAGKMAKLEGCAHVVYVRNFFRENNTAYMIKGYTEGVTLAKKVKKAGGRLEYTESMHYMLMISKALKEIHDKGIIHFNINPDSILIDNNNQIKLINFGFVRQIIGETSNKLSVFLKKGYTPREQYDKLIHCGPWTDVYSLGAMFYYILTGNLPPDSRERLKNDRLISPSMSGINIEEQDEQAIMKALSVRCEERFQKVDEFIAALKPLIEAKHDAEKNHEEEKPDPVIINNTGQETEKQTESEQHHQTFKRKRTSGRKNMQKKTLIDSGFNRFQEKLRPYFLPVVTILSLSLILVIVGALGLFNREEHKDSDKATAGTADTVNQLSEEASESTETTEQAEKIISGSTLIAVPEDYNTIQSAINNATDGAEIVVEPGLYYENIDYNGKNITIRCSNPHDPDIVKNTIINGGNNGSTVTFRNRESSGAVLEGFTITEGSGTWEVFELYIRGEREVFERYYGGGILIINSSPTIKNNIITGNNIKPGGYANSGDIGVGGGVAILSNSSPQIHDNIISSNHVRGHGGGIGVFDNSKPEINNNTISDNTADDIPALTRKGGLGGGLVITYSNVKLNNNRINNNKSDLTGGGVYLAFGEGVFEGNEITGNASKWGGGGIIVWGESNTVFNSNIFRNNKTEKEGGAIYLGNKSNISAKGNTFSGNIAYEDGGAIFIEKDSSVQGNVYANNSFDGNKPDNLYRTN